MMSSSCPISCLPTLVRSGVWFVDGNIVLAAGGVAFKVHRGQLARHSEVFQGLFSVPTPSDEELYDGCQCVKLYDCPEDVYHFLVALYDGLYVEIPKAEDFSSISGVLRLAMKYMVEHLRRQALARLEMDWPATLRAWDERERAAIDKFQRYSPRDLYAHPILVLNLGLELGLTSILPAAFYDLSRYGPSRITEGTPEPISARISSSLSDEDDDQVPSVPDDKHSEQRMIQLSFNMLTVIFRGREKAQRYVARFIATEICRRPPSVTCTNACNRESLICHESFYFIMLNILRSVGGIASGRDGDPLFTLVQAMEMLSRTDFTDGVEKMGLKLCQDCKVDFAISATRAREEVWRRIPSWFGLEEGIEEELAVDVDPAGSDVD